MKVDKSGIETKSCRLYPPYSLIISAYDIKKVNALLGFVMTAAIFVIKSKK
jgi:hypothetical protein